MAFNTETAVTNKSGTRLDVTVNAVVVEDTSIYSNSAITIGSDTAIETFLTVGTIIEVLTLSMASLNSNNLYKISLKSDVSSGNDLFIAYCVAGVQLNPNMRFTVPNSSDDNLYINIEKLTGADAGDVAVAVTYRLTAP